jgi:hypothetical protein
MGVRGYAVKAFLDTTTVVHNYAMLAETKKQRMLVLRMSFLRKMEMLEREVSHCFIFLSSSSLSLLQYHRVLIVSSSLTHSLTKMNDTHFTTQLTVASRDVGSRLRQRHQR